MVDDCRLRTDRRNGHGLRSEKGSEKRRLTRQQVQRDAAVLAFYALMPIAWAPVLVQALARRHAAA
jgi:hypothetical protein